MRYPAIAAFFVKWPKYNNLQKLFPAEVSYNNKNIMLGTIKILWHQHFGHLKMVVDLLEDGQGWLIFKHLYRLTVRYCQAIANASPLCAIIQKTSSF